MTTAHRPTFDPARGKEAARGEAYHQRLLPAHKTLKFRQAAQGTPDEQAKRDLKAELLRAEAKHYAKKEGRQITEDDEDAPAQREALQIEDGEGESGGAKRKLEDASGGGGAEAEVEEDYEAKKRRVLEETRDIDADSEESEESDSESEDEEEDETAELMRELAKIKAERAEAAAKAAEEQAKKDEEQREKYIALGNPLLNGKKEDYGVKRRWDDDVVFKNQARGTEERGKEKRFVNDLLRSDFHRRFMDKYVR
ncbi:Pre-mRNA-splicing factor cwc15 [Fulvia fulva]|uniref:Pre-mRNA-splicing factor cwc15 n=1 Tax=Passalora fulva TaxID=5499 RepID=A0A9Q8LJL0_PASFU|nr:Pre-mRNA-splicing factor cwc15 [Fulvia fulva]KAK4623681.1 Pre-mRNA-splicing factor cwc15 [Fulvia fulva]KAK4625398.1 Pre-mRNA-splicing factor cwc15 [Fulvia fulva]UJO18354.1 Pre-mRNA-splicing factor cwc15 [Fulvia fulva]WPV15464.1 Pre-mRNA-splicing factor cwc15 [Fulvia fulva]WPV29604.1 Pre-mRNA-splicing factor cwc15 [Fulvia fulva]